MLLHWHISVRIGIASPLQRNPHGCDSRPRRHRLALAYDPLAGISMGTEPWQIPEQKARSSVWEQNSTSTLVPANERASRKKTAFFLAQRTGRPWAT